MYKLVRMYDLPLDAKFIFNQIEYIKIHSGQANAHSKEEGCVSLSDVMVYVEYEPLVYWNPQNAT